MPEAYKTLKMFCILNLLHTLFHFVLVITEMTPVK